MEYGFKVGFFTGGTPDQWILSVSGDSFLDIGSGAGNFRVYAGIGCDLPLYSYLNNSLTGTYIFTLDLGVLYTFDNIFPIILNNLAIDLFYKFKFNIVPEQLFIFTPDNYLSMMWGSFVLCIGYRI